MISPREMKSTIARDPGSWLESAISDVSGGKGRVFSRVDSGGTGRLPAVSAKIMSSAIKYELEW